MLPLNKYCPILPCMKRIWFLKARKSVLCHRTEDRPGSKLHEEKMSSMSTSLQTGGCTTLADNQIKRKCYYTCSTLINLTNLSNLYNCNMEIYRKNISVDNIKILKQLWRIMKLQGMGIKTWCNVGVYLVPLHWWNDSLMESNICRVHKSVMQIAYFQ